MVTAAGGPFICNHCRLRIARNHILVRSQRRGLRTRPNYQPRLVSDNNVILDGKPRDDVTGTDVKSSEVLYKPLGASSDEYFAQQITTTTSQGDPQVVDQVEDEGGDLDLGEPHEDGQSDESGNYAPATSWEGLKTFRPSEWDAIVQYEG